VSVKWTQGKYQNYAANLGGGLILTINWSSSREDHRQNKSYLVEVFGKSIGGFADVPEAKKAAESKAREVLAQALEILEEK
jgi:hypothetical protein